MEIIYEKAKAIKLVIFDVDGVLTDGKLIYGNHNTELKAFHVRDGLGMVLLQKTGVALAIITARQSELVTKRMQDLHVKHVFQGYSDKTIAYDEIKTTLNLTDAEIAYVGDDLPDLPLLRRVGLSMTVPDAPAIIQQYAMWTTPSRGGEGAAREVCELIMHAQNTLEPALLHYLEK